MNNQQAVVEQIVQNLAFEVEAVPKDRTIRTTSISKSTPLNVKIRVRKKDVTQTQHDVSSVVDEPTKGLQKIRLVSSDQTIMTFDVFMEAEFEKKPLRRPRKNILNILKPGICLGAMDDEDYPYMPSSSYSAKITEPTVTTRSDGVLKQKFTLSKNTYENYTVSAQTDGQKWLFGKCKPGGCLDPPFSEDKYSYKPSPSIGLEQIVPEPNVSKNDKLGDEDVKSDVKSNGRHSSVFDGGLFKKRRKSSDKSTNTLDGKENETDSILSIYQVESTVNSLSTHSNSIITYPPKKSSENINDDKTARSRGPSEDKSRKSFNDHSEPYFIPPKGINRLKEKDPLNQNDYSKHRSSDVSDTKTKPKEYLKMPMPLPIPIPIPIPLVSDKHKPKDGTANIDIMKTQVDDDDISETKSSLDKINLKRTEIPEQSSKTELATEDIDHNPLESINKRPSPVPFNDDLFKQQSPTLDDDTIKLDTDKENMTKTKEQQDKDKDDNISPKGTRIPENEFENVPIKLPIPIPVPFNISKPEHPATITKCNDPNAQNSDISMSKINESDQLLGVSTSTEDIKDAPSKGSKIIRKDGNLRKKSGERNSSVTALNKNSQYSESDNKETIADPKKYLRTRSEPFNEESDTTENEIIITKEPTMQGDMRRESNDEKLRDELLKLANQNSINNKEDQGIELIDTTTENDLKKNTNENELPNAENKLNPDLNLVQNFISERTSQYLTPVPQTTEPVIKKNKTSAASIINDKRRNDSDDKQDLNKSNHNEKALSNNNDELKSTLRSGLKDEIDIDSGKVSPINRDKENDATSANQRRKIKLNNDDDVFSFSGGSRLTNNGSFNFITAPVIIDPTEQIPQFVQLKQVNSETNLVGEPEIPGYEIDSSGNIFKPQLSSRFRADDDDIVTHSTISRELIGNTIIYDLDDFLPSTSSVKHSEKLGSTDKRVLLREDVDKDGTEIITKSPRISDEPRDSNDELRNKLTNKSNARSISVLSSTSTLKSALKKDKICVELAFQSYLNDKNERIIRTFDATNKPTRLPNDSVTVIKSQIKLSSNEIRIPVDSDHDMSIQIKKPNTNQRVSLSESGFVNTFEKDKIKQKVAVQTNDGEIRSSGAKEYLSENIMDSNVIDLYEQELVPLQLIIKNLRDEIDVLAAQQLIFRDKIFCPKKSKLPRLVHTNKKCVGCLRK